MSRRTVADVRRITGREELPASARELAHMIMHTCYMGTKNSSAETRERAALVAEQIGIVEEPLRARDIEAA